MVASFPVPAVNGGTPTGWQVTMTNPGGSDEFAVSFAVCASGA